MSQKLIFDKIKEEQGQYHNTRVSLYRNLEKSLGGIRVVSFFTSFAYQVMIEDQDADMLEAILQKTDLKNGLILLINSPGGDGLAAEKIINICRTYSGTNKYSVVVPSRAKSAATMVCLGAEKIIMGKTSELGPVDPQWLIEENGKPKIYSVYRMIQNYRKLFDDAVSTKGNIQPFLQQLATYDPRDIADYQAALDTAEDISVKALKACVLAHRTEDEIKKDVEMFLKPETVKTHGRAIYAADAKKCGLNVDL